MDSELKALRKELAILGDEFSQRIKGVEQRIDYLESKRIWTTGDEASGLPSESSKISDVNPINDKIVAEDTPSVSIHLPVTAVPVNKEFTVEAASLKFKSSTRVAPSDKNPSKSPSDWELDAAANKASNQSLFSLIAPMLGPLAALFEMFSKLYKHYQEQGKAPVFFLTLTGVVALVFGFGYLLQYSFNEHLGPVGKMLLGSVFAVAVTAGGIRFTLKNHDMAEYGSSIIALGVILSFLCAYFAGPYYGLLSDFWGFLLLALVTAAAYVLALRFETRVVAIVTLVGGVAMPLVMGHVDFSPQLYLSYLLVLAIAMLNLAHRIKWPQLAFVTMVLSAGMIEFSVGSRNILPSEPFGLIAIIHGFFYAFAYFSLKGLSASEISKSRLIIISSNVMFYLFISQQLVVSNALLGGLFLVNALPWLCLFTVANKIFSDTAKNEVSRKIKALALLHAGLLAGVGILVLSSPELVGVIWCVEALILIYLGAKFQFTSVRVEGYIALLISLVTMGGNVVVWLLESLKSSPILLNIELGMGWANLIALTVLLYCAAVLIKKQQAVLLDKERRLLLVLENLLSVGLSLSFLLTVGSFLGQIMWLLACVPMFYLIWRAQSKRLVITELLGLGHLLLLIVPMASSAAILGHFHFSDQTIYAQIARVEIFACLWLIAEFYKRFFPQSANIGFTENLRKIFYCLIPLLFLPNILRQHSDYFPIALWGSSVIALFLFSRLNYRVLMVELRILVSIASVVALVSCGLVELSAWSGNAVGALGLGLLFYVLTGWYGQALQRAPSGSDLQVQINKALSPMYSIGVYYLGTAVFIVGYKVSSNIELGILLSLFYFISFFFFKIILAPIRTTLRVAYFVSFALFFLLTISNGMHAVMHSSGVTQELSVSLISSLSVIVMAMLVFKPGSQVRSVWQRSGGRIVSIWVFNLVAVAAYISLLSHLFTDMLGPIVSFFLVAHATIILFQTLEGKYKKLIWLSGLLFGVAAIKVLLWDMSDFSVVQKIVVFMLIGVCMLGAAFKFQKVSRQDSR